MKSILILVVILMAVVFLSAQVNVCLTNMVNGAPQDTLNVFNGNQDICFLTFDVENVEAEPVVLNTVSISCMNINLGNWSELNPTIQFQLYSNDGQWPPTNNNIFDLNFQDMNSIIQPGWSKTFVLIGTISSNSNGGSKFCLGIGSGQNLNVTGQNSGEQYLATQYGPQWDNVFHVINLHKMHKLAVWPARNAGQEQGVPYNYGIDTLYVFPGQFIRYSSMMYSDYFNHLENTAIGFQMNLSLDTPNNTNELVVESAPHPTDGMIGNIGLVSFDDNTPFGCNLAWVSNTMTGINTCGLVEMTVSNHIPIGNTGSIWANLHTYNYHESFGMVEEGTYHSIHLISNNRMRGDIDGLNGFQDNDKLLALQIFTQLQNWYTEFNPEGSWNIAGSYIVFPFPSMFNAWVLNAEIPGLGIGELYDGTWPALVPVTYTNTTGNVSIETPGNVVSVYWQNLDGTYQSETIMFADGLRAFKWTTSVEPTEIAINRNDTLFQLPEGATLLDVKAAQIDYLPTANDDPVIPVAPTLNNAFPNPFNAQTSISYNLPKSGSVEIEIYNVKGQLVKTLVNETKSTGSHNAIWSGTDNHNKTVPAGVYFYKMVSGKYSATKKVILMKNLSAEIRSTYSQL